MMDRLKDIVNIETIFKETCYFMFVSEISLVYCSSKISRFCMKINELFHLRKL